MKLIFIYGPPASGKFTVAKELAKITDFKLYHNHLAHDLIGSILTPKKHKNFFNLTDDINFFVLSSVAKENIPGVIFTYCYCPDDAKFVRKIIDSIEKYKGEVNFVQLTCNKSELFSRVTEESRKKYGKLQKVEDLKNLLIKTELYQKISFVESLPIDNTSISAKETAQKIKNHYNL